jgi:predicted metal-dependent phosphoesterase TrpH
MKKNIIVSIILISVVFSGLAVAQQGARDEIEIPDILGYITLKCDFHMHTVFSDGEVWPFVRPREIWQEGLDAFAITEHVDWMNEDLGKDQQNRSYEIAQGTADRFGVTNIRGGEITIRLPVGHYNGIFLKDAVDMNQKNWFDGLVAAKAQGAFIFWNHPGWSAPDEIPTWSEHQDKAFNAGLMDGIEIVNENAYYPLAHKWAIERNLTMVGNSDIHPAINEMWDVNHGEHRPMTLVFAKSDSQEDIREALDNRRTAVYRHNYLIGDIKFLMPIFENSLVPNKKVVEVPLKGSGYLQVTNNSQVTYELELVEANTKLNTPKTITLHADRTVEIRCSAGKAATVGTETLTLKYVVKNLYVAPEEGMPLEYKIKVNFTEK